MRKHYLDNLRSFCILLLFPYHTSMVYNAVESFFVYYGPTRPFSDFIILCQPWFMALLFLLAGISSRLSLEKRTTKQYLKERVTKLLVPFVFGLLVLAPPQTYFAERFHNGYSSGYFSQYGLFFQNFTELTGYFGGFTPAHFWFLIYLFVFSLVALPFFTQTIKKQKEIFLSTNNPPLTAKKSFARFGMKGLLALGLVPLSCGLILNISGKSIGEYFTLFLLGFYIFSDDEIIALCKKYKWPLSAVSAVLLITADLLFHANFVSLNLYTFLGLMVIMWVSVLALLGLGASYLNFSNKITSYLAKSSFPVYILHQPILLSIAYYVLQYVPSAPYIQASLILVLSVVFTYAAYEIARRIPPLRWVLGIAKPKTSSTMHAESK